jgi:protein-tyrosine phosphatase
LFAQPYADLFRKLADGALPLVFHCAAGKDRTGIAAALILTSLGVPRDTVFDDYLLTDRAVDLEAALFQHRRTSIGVGDEHAHLRTIGREARAPLLEARPEYLDAAIEQIEGEYGSVEVYLRQRLGVTDEMLRSLHSHLLET